MPDIFLTLLIVMIATAVTGSLTTENKPLQDKIQTLFVFEIAVLVGVSVYAILSAISHHG